MNPIIFSATPMNGLITIPLSRPCKCWVGLVSIDLPNLNRQGINESYHDFSVFCDQIDSTMWNRKRLLRQFCFDKEDEIYSSHQFDNIMYFPLDSSDSKLTIRLHDQFGPIDPPRKVGRKLNGEKVIITLNIIPEDGASSHWTKFI